MATIDDYLLQQLVTASNTESKRARDEFAKAAMQTLIMEGIFPTTSSTTDGESGNTTTTTTPGKANKDWPQVAIDAWNCAEAMMKERRKRGYS